MNGEKTATNRRQVGPIAPPVPDVTRNTIVKSTNPLAPDGTVELANPARRVGLRQLVKAKLVTPKDALAWLRKVDPNPNPRIVAWLEKKVGL